MNKTPSKMKNFSPVALASLFLGLIGFSFPTEAQRCENIFRFEARASELKTKNEHVREIFAEFQATFNSPEFKDVLLGLQKPDWNTYNKALQFLKKISSEDFVLNSMDRTSLLRATKSFNALAENKLNEIKNDPQKIGNYKRFLDYHMAYFRLVEKINLKLKFDLIPLPDFNLVAKDTHLRKKGREQVLALEKFINEKFETTGHKTYNDYIKYAENYSEGARDIMGDIENDLVVAVHRPESARFWIPLAGFQNQRVTGSSKGSFFTDSVAGQLSMRDIAEANLTLRDGNEYMNESARFKPNYGEVRPSPENKVLFPASQAGQYGSDLWILKKKVTEERVTWVPIDSLGPGTYSRVSNEWGRVFIPWRYRQLMTPYALSEKGFIPTPKPRTFKLSGDPLFSSASRYFETQIWGPLQLSDVKSFIFKNNPPDRDFYNLLVENGIEVWDERTWPAKRYYGEN